MALTKDDIEAAIAQTENQDAIRHFIEPTHYFENLDEPVAVAIGISKSGGRGAMESANINEIVEILRKNGIDAVSMMDKEATDPAKFVVNESGVLTPFMKPEDALKATTLICDMCLNSGYEKNGYANLQTSQTILYSASVNAQDENRDIDIFKGNPHPEIFAEISAKYGKDIPSFIDEMVQEAVQNSEEINAPEDFLENYVQGYDHVWRGGTLGANPYAAIYPSNDRKVAYASPNLGISSGYTGCVPTSSGASGAQYPETISGIHYGNLYLFKTLGDKQRYHPDMGLQSATGGHYIDVEAKQSNTPSSKDDFETGILPHNNKLEALYLHVQSKDDYDENIKVYKIELDEYGKAKDQRWQDFLALHEPTDSSVRGNIAERQDNQKKEQEENPNNSYPFEIHDNLPEKNYKNEKYTSLDYLKTIAFKEQIIEEGKTVSVIGDLKLSPKEDLSTKDLSDVIINGKLDFMGYGLLSSFEHFPKTKNGITHAVFIGDLDNETTESLLCKTKGTAWVEKYTHKAEDGHLVVDGEPVIEYGQQVEGKKILNFGNLAPSRSIFGMFDLPSLRMNPTSWPKDVLNVEFNCDVDFNRIENGAKLENLPSSEQIKDFNKMTQEIDNLRKQKDNTDLLILSIPQKLDLSQYKCSYIECEGHTHIIELPPSVEKLSYNYIDNMQSDEIPEKLNTISSLSFNKVSSDLINIDNLNDAYIHITNSNLNLNVSGNNSYFSIENSELTLSLTGSVKEQLSLYDTKLKNGTELDLSKCSRFFLNNCSLPENLTLDLSQCKRVDLSNVDLSKVSVIMPKEGIVNISENVKFAPDFKLDLSKCEEGSIHPSVQCDEVKLPQKLISENLDDIQLPPSVKEITTSCLTSGHVGKIAVPPHVKIIDTPDKNGKKIPLKALKARGLSKEQIATLRKERFMNMFRSSSKALKPASVEQDMAVMSKETGTAVFSYDDIHNSKVENTFHYDYKKVIDGVSKAQKITPLEAEKKLLEYEVIRPMPNGEYKLDVDNAKRGGGANFDGVLYFNQSNEDYHTRYHEMAHSYQKKDNLFDDTKLDKMYAISEKGLKAGENKTEKLAAKKDYLAYLHEVHSDTFAQVSLMLRETGTLGFAKQALYAQSHGEMRNAIGLLADGKREKKYACKPVMHAAIKEVASIRKSGKRAEYFNPDGTLNAKKVSDLCEKIVLDNAYSPRTYKSFLDGNFQDNATSKEKDWRKGSILAVAKSLPAAGAILLLNSANIVRKKISKTKHNALMRKEKLMLQSMTKQRQKIDNPQVQAANDYAYIQAKLQLIAAKSISPDADNLTHSFIKNNMYQKELLKADFQKFEKDFYAKGSLKDFEDINKVLQENKDNPHFQTLMENPAKFAEMRRGMNKTSEKSKENPSHELSLSDKDKIIALSGRGQEHSSKPQQTNETSIQQLYKNRDNAVEQTAEMVEKHNFAQKIGMKIGTFINGLRHGQNLKTGEGYIPGRQSQNTSQSRNNTIANSNTAAPPKIPAAQIRKSNEGR